jgi:hypothetical protein
MNYFLHSCAARSGAAARRHPAPFCGGFHVPAGAD